MTKIAQFAVFLSLVLVPAAAYSATTSKEVADKQAQISDLRDAINVLADERHAKEEALVVEYKVKECNTKRNNLAVEYAELMQPINLQIDQLLSESNSLVNEYKQDL